MAESEDTRRVFLTKLATLSGAAVLFPLATRCASAPKGSMGTAPAAGAPGSSLPLPTVRPADWEPLAFNRKRGNAGAIPKTYLADINGADGDKKHLGKHLPFVPQVDAKLIPAGYIAVMWGDPAKGHARHPNAPKDTSKSYRGHWYNWVKVRKAVEGAAEELQNTYPDWPGTAPDNKTQFAALGGGDIAADGGKNTIYLVKLPPDVKAGDTIRLWGHCLYHGEYVDFLTI